MRFGFGFGFVFGFVFGFGFGFESSRRASRAPEPGVAEEQPMSERSEFGLRAASGEERREPARRSRVGSCPAMAVLLTFDKTKVSRANSAEALFFAASRGHVE